jgi:hypothetical protein
MNNFNELINGDTPVFKKGQTLWRQSGVVPTGQLVSIIKSATGN